MSGHSYSITCPNCGDSADAYQDHKPFDLIAIQCMSCGLCISPTISYLNLEDLNEYRGEQGIDLEPLSELPKQGIDF